MIDEYMLPRVRSVRDMLLTATVEGALLRLRFVRVLRQTHATIDVVFCWQFFGFFFFVFLNDGAP